MFGSLHPPYNAGFLRLSKPEKLQPLPPDEDKVDPPPQERKEDPSAIGLAATTDDDNRTPTPTKEVTLAASSEKAETFGETSGETPPSPSNSMKEASPETSASQDSSGAKLHPPRTPTRQRSCANCSKKPGARPGRDEATTAITRTRREGSSRTAIGRPARRPTSGASHR